MSAVVIISTLIHLCLVSHKRDICKQCRPRSDAAEWNIWSGSTLFAFNTGIEKKNPKKRRSNKTNQTPLLLEKDFSKVLR